MVLVDIIIVIILIFAFIGGIVEGAIKSFFRLLGFIIALPLTMFLYPMLANILSFLPGQNWENFISFIIIVSVLSTIFYLIFFIPRKLIEKIWIKIDILRLIGGCLNLLNSAIGFVVLTLLIQTYPIMGWLEDIVTQSSVLTWLVTHLQFIQVLVPGLFNNVPARVIYRALLN